MPHPTHLVYMEDFNLLELDAAVVEVMEENARTVVILDQTIFYAQGGGQPYDQGIMTAGQNIFRVEEVRFMEGIVKHIGTFVSGTFAVGETVHCVVDTARRKLHCRLHSAGHVVDMAVHALSLGWIPGKGFHFPEGPYVEYAGNLEGVDKEKLKADIETGCQKFIAEDRATKLVFMPKEKMAEVCHHVPDYLPAGKPARVVMYGDFGVPCGGTHVSHLGEIQGIIIRKIKMDGQNIRVGYDIHKE